MDSNKIIFPIPPQTNIRSTQGDRIIFRIPTDCRKLKGKKPCHLFRKTGECPHILSVGGRARKRRLERYNQYKVDVKALADSLGFKMPTCGWSVYFFFPIPKRWKKYKKEAMHGQLHLSKPDRDNCEKALQDSLSTLDERAAHLSGVGKYWIDPDKIENAALKAGYIEIYLNQEVYSPFGLPFIDQDQFNEAPKRKWVKKDTPDNRKIRKVVPLKLATENLFKKEDKIK